MQKYKLNIKTKNDYINIENSIFISKIYVAGRNIYFFLKFKGVISLLYIITEDTLTKDANTRVWSSKLSIQFLYCVFIIVVRCIKKKTFTKFFKLLKKGLRNAIQFPMLKY